MSHFYFPTSIENLLKNHTHPHDHARCRVVYEMTLLPMGYGLFLSLTVLS